MVVYIRYRDLFTLPDALLMTMNEPKQHLLYSYRRCPYAMRARMSLIVAKIPCSVIDVDFKNKPEHLLQISPKGTVPVLQTIDGEVLEESLDIVKWALGHNDPEQWLNIDTGEAFGLIAQNDDGFKTALDRYKYPNRYPDEDCTGARDQAEKFLSLLNDRLSEGRFLMGNQLSVADITIFPFVRQFANVDRQWFDNQTQWPHLQVWLKERLESALFLQVMEKQKEQPYNLLQ